MKKVLLTVIALLIFISAAVGCTPEAVRESVAPPPDEMPSDFDFSLNFGIDGKNVIDTYEDTFTKDLIIAGTETIPFEIPADKMREIYAEFLIYEIYALPDNINDATPIYGSYGTLTPAAVYTLRYTCDGETRTIVSDDGGPWDSDDGYPITHERLVTFVTFVKDYIYSTEEYQSMPEEEGGYA